MKDKKKNTDKLKYQPEHQRVMGSKPSQGPIPELQIRSPAPVRSHARGN